MFESLLPGVRDGHALVRELKVGNALGDSYDYGDYLEPDDDADLSRLNVWLTIATSSAALEVNLEIHREVCPARAPGSVEADVWWPAAGP